MRWRSLQYLQQGRRIPTLSYRGYTIASRTYQVRSSGGVERWAVGVVIGRWGSLRAFDSQVTATSEEGATELCRTFGRLIIDHSPHAKTLSDLAGERRVAAGPTTHR